jgi:hypothetical protein
MDFNKLLQRMAELDQPTTTTEACGDMMPSTSVPPAENVQPPSMSVNLNAQGMDNIESLMKLMTKVNPDMINKPMPAADPVSMIMPPVDMDGNDDGDLDGTKSEIAPLAAVGAGLGRAAAGSMGAGSVGKAVGSMAGSSIGSAAADMMNTDSDDVESREEYANEPEEEYKDIDYVTNKVAGGMNKPQGTYPKVAGGDNPMQKISRMEGTELRAAIRAELLQRLAEAKGAK